MPQPFKNFIAPNGEYSIRFDSSSLREEPMLAAKVAEVIAGSSQSDYGLAIVLANVLHASPDAAYAIFCELMDSRLKDKALLAAAKPTLDEPDYLKLTVILQIVRLQTDIRNKFAHWVWGTSPQAPNALLLSDSRYLQSHSWNLEKFGSKTLHEGGVSEHFEAFRTAMSYDFTKIYVYNEKELNNIVEKDKFILMMIGNMQFITSPSMNRLERDISMYSTEREHSMRDHARMLIETDGTFQAALARHVASKAKHNTLATIESSDPRSVLI